jgi:hypothetical protein
MQRGRDETVLGSPSPTYSAKEGETQDPRETIDEVWRPASLQKRREMKAAGTLPHDGKVKRRFIDYANEIPFEKIHASRFL